MTKSKGRLLKKYCDPKATESVIPESIDAHNHFLKRREAVAGGAWRAEMHHFLRHIQGRAVHGFCRHSINSTRLFMVSLSDALSWTIFRSAS